MCKYYPDFGEAEIEAEEQRAWDAYCDTGWGPLGFSADFLRKKTMGEQVNIGEKYKYTRWTLDQLKPDVKLTWNKYKIVVDMDKMGVDRCTLVTLQRNDEVQLTLSVRPLDLEHTISKAIEHVDAWLNVNPTLEKSHVHSNQLDEMVAGNHKVWCDAIGDMAIDSLDIAFNSGDVDRVDYVITNTTRILNVKEISVGIEYLAGVLMYARLGARDRASYKEAVTVLLEACASHGHPTGQLVRILK